MGCGSKKDASFGNLGGAEKFYSCATDINDSKQVVGISEVNVRKNGHYCYHAFLWDKGTIFDLGTLENDRDSVALAINCQGDAVGSSGDLYYSQGMKRAFIWTSQDSMRDLNSIVNADTIWWHYDVKWKLSDLNWKIEEAVDINDNGQIVCRATVNGKPYIVLLTPGH